MANEYLSKRYDLRDSLMDYKVKEQVATLESRIIIQKNEIAQERNKNELLTIKNRNRILGILAVIFALTGIALYLYYRHRQIFLQTKIEENEENIKVFIQTLIRKNARIKSLEDKLSDITEEGTQLFPKVEMIDNLLNLSILSPEDWTAFKQSFDKVYSGFIVRLRSSFNLSEAEERLFILLKIKLTKLEIATIQGISPDTVKKTRNRLRKRLGLSIDDSLEQFIENY